MRHTAFLVLSGFLAVALTSCGGSIPTPASGAFTTDRSVLESTLPSTQLHYRAVPLPKGFVPLDIMEDGHVPGSIGRHAAIFKNGHLTILPDFSGCPAGGLNTAASVNSLGEAVGFCDGTNVGIPLFYKDGRVTRLVSSEQRNSDINCMTINDLGVIVGDVEQRGNSSSGLFQFYSDGRHATFIGFGGQANCWINDNNLIATTDVGNGILAEFVQLSGATRFLFPNALESAINWMNESGTVVGFEGTNTFENFIDTINRKPSFIPGRNIGLTGINDKNEIIAQGTSDIFMFANGEKTDISPDIYRAGDYTLFAQNFYGYLGGLSDRGEFVAQKHSTGEYYFISPDR